MNYFSIANWTNQVSGLLSLLYPGFPTSVEDMGGVDFQNLMGRAKVNTWGEHGGLKIVPKNTCEGVHLIVTLPAISLQACKFTKN